MSEILAAYVCKACQVHGRGSEAEPGIVPCWCCGEPAVITAFVSGGNSDYVPA